MAAGVVCKRRLSQQRHQTSVQHDGSCIHPRRAVGCARARDHSSPATGDTHLAAHSVERLILWFRQRASRGSHIYGPPTPLLISRGGAGRGAAMGSPWRGPPAVALSITTGTTKIPARRRLCALQAGPEGQVQGVRVRRVRERDARRGWVAGLTWAEAGWPRWFLHPGLVPGPCHLPRPLPSLILAQRAAPRGGASWSTKTPRR